MASVTHAPSGATVVTGAASGMGRLLAQRWAATGHRVIGVDRDADGLADVTGLAGTLVCDVADATAVQGAAASIEQEHGSIGTLVTAAGIARSGRIADLPSDTYRQVIEVNYLGTVHWVTAVLDGMRSRGTGRIVGFASLAAWMPTPLTAPYTASKFAVAGFLECLSMESTKEGIQVLGVCPPAVDTPMLDGILAEGAVPSRVTRMVSPIDPVDVLDAIDRGLTDGRLWAFPGRGTAALYRMRRFSPWLLRRTSRLLYGL